LKLKNGEQYDGIFVKGAFSSVKQEYFKKLEENQIKINKIKTEVAQFFTELDTIFSDKKGFKEKMKTNMAIN